MHRLRRECTQTRLGARRGHGEVLGGGGALARRLVYADRHTLSEPLARLEPLEHACCLLVLNIVPVHKRSRVQR